LTTLGCHKIVAFVAVRDPDRARAFYGDTLGLHLVSDDRHFAFDAHGTMLRVTMVRTVTAPRYTLLGWHLVDRIFGVQESGQARDVS